MPQAKNAEEFIAQQKIAVASNPECGTSKYNLAVALIGIKKYDEAEEILKDATECSPNLAEAYVQLGGLCLRRGDTEGCLRYNKYATKARAGFAPAFGNLGFIYMQEGKIDDAIKNLQKAIVFNSKFVQAYTTLANAYLAKGLIEESIKTNKKALKIEPHFPVAHNNIAIAYLENGDMELFAKHCQIAIDASYEVAPEIIKELENYKNKEKI